MSKRLSLLMHQPCQQSYMQKTARTELSDDHPQQCSGSRNSGASMGQSDMERSQHKFIEFEEFSNDHQPVYQYQPNLLKKKLNIDVPQEKFEPRAQEPNRSISEKPQKDYKDRTAMKEPPAPSKGSDKCQARVFVFPVAKTNGNTPVIRQPCSIPNITLNTFGDPSQPGSPVPSSRMDSRPMQSPNHGALVQQIQNMKKDILIRDSQIAVLQKIISDSLQTQHPSLAGPHFARHSPSQELLQQKDDLNNELMSKIVELTSALKAKSQELALYKYENHKMECLVESMQYDAYITDKKHQSDAIREPKRREQSTHWDEERVSLGNSGPSIANNNVSIKHIEIRKCQKEDEVKRKKVISRTKEEHHTQPVLQQPHQQQVWYCQTSKHKPKCSGAFDFKQAKENISETGVIKKRRKEAA